MHDERVAVHAHGFAQQVLEVSGLLGDLPSGAALRERGWWPVWDDRLQGALRRVLIAQQMRGRDVEHRADIVETGRDVVLRQQVLHLHGAAEQITERGLVFRAVEPAQDHAPIALLAGERGGEQVAVQFGGDDVQLLRRRTRRLWRRHLALRQFVEHLHPRRGGVLVLELRRQRVQAQLGFLHVRPVALDAMRVSKLAELRSKRLCHLRWRLRRRLAGQHQNRDQSQKRARGGEQHGSADAEFLK